MFWEIKYVANMVSMMILGEQMLTLGFSSYSGRSISYASCVDILYELIAVYGHV